jgi:hypothetical protein
MTRQEIRREADKINKKIREWQHRKDILQMTCQHEKVKKIPRANTGNYDPSQDCYWYECHCPGCDKFWMEDQ